MNYEGPPPPPSSAYGMPFASSYAIESQPFSQSTPFLADAAFVRWLDIRRRAEVGVEQAVDTALSIGENWTEAGEWKPLSRLLEIVASDEVLPAEVGVALLTVTGRVRGCVPDRRKLVASVRARLAETMHPADVERALVGLV